MNKLGMVLGLAAVATLAGCKDPDWKSDRVTPSQNEVKNVDTTETTPVAEPEVKKCTCAPGTKHSAPCACGASDCKCIVETKPVETMPVAKPVEKPVAKPVEPEYTVYIVQNGDYLAKISKKYNVTINSVKRLNPSIKKDFIWVGQKLKLPGKIDVGVQEAPKAAPAKATPKKAAASYTGATKEYVVKNGDTLGAIAYGNGITIRQLKALNGLSSDSLKIGQKIRIPAEKVAAAKPAAKKEAAPAAKPVAAKVEEKVAAEPVVEAPQAEPAPAAAAEEQKEKDDVALALKQLEEKKDDAAPAEAAPAATATYVVQEGDDMTGVSIRWGVSAADIRELNNMAEGDQLVPGQIIKLPADAQQ